VPTCLRGYGEEQLRRRDRFEEARTDGPHSTRQRAGRNGLGGTALEDSDLLQPEGGIEARPALSAPTPSIFFSPRQVALRDKADFSTGIFRGAAHRMTNPPAAGRDPNQAQEKPAPKGRT
jgi:hypothetical protein